MHPKIRKAWIRLLSEDQVFYAFMLSRFEMAETRELPTMGVSAANGRFTFTYNPDFLDLTSDDELPKLIEHEVQHLFRVFHERNKNLNNEIFNVAQDITINDDIKDMPKKVKVLGKDGNPQDYELCFSSVFSNIGIKKDSSSEVNYKLLDKNKKQLGMGRENNIIIVRHGGKGYASPCQQPDIRDKYSEEKIKQVIIEVAKEAERTCGNIPGNLRTIISNLAKNKINWKKHVRNFCATTKATNKESTFKRPNRRYNLQKGTKRDHKAQLVLVMDTSGSVGDKELSAFLSEIHTIHKLGVEFHVIECDAAVGKAFKYSKRLKYSVNEVTGRGGTDFRPPFEYVKKHRMNPDGIIYFTDLCGPFPNGSKIRTLWVNTHQKDAKSPFGKTIFLEL